MSHSYTIVALIILSAFCLPIFWMVLHPLLVHCIHQVSISQSFTNRHNFQQQQPFFGGNQKDIQTLLTFQERFSKFALTVIYVPAMLLVCTSTVKFALGGDYGRKVLSSSSLSSLVENVNFMSIADDHERSSANSHYIHAHVVNDTRGGSVSYLLGVSLGILGLALMRIHWSRCVHDHVNDDDENDHKNVSQINSDHRVTNLNASDSRGGDNLGYELMGTDEPNGVLAPPTSAFQIPWNRGLNNVVGSENSQNNGLNSSRTKLPGQYLDESKSTSFTMETRTHDQNLNGDLNQTMGLQISNLEGRKNLNWISRVVHLEAGILSCILLVPVYTLPLIRLKYEGLTATLLEPSTTDIENSSLSIWNIARSISMNSGHGILASISTLMFWSNVIIIPFLVCISSLLVCSQSIWDSGGTNTALIKHSTMFKTLQFLQPCSNTTPFALSILLTVMSIGQVSNFLFNRYGFCETLEDVLGLDKNGGNCLVINGKLLPGFWFLLCQALGLDIFAITTLSRFS